MPDTPIAAQADANNPSPAVSAPKMRVLIVEDEKPLAHALEMKLKNSGYDVQAVNNGEEALTTMLMPPLYDMLLLDLIMPKLDGFSVMQALKEKGVSVPIIVLSNLGQEEDRRKAKELGAVQYFVKSNTPISEIIAAVQKTLSEKSSLKIREATSNQNPANP